MSMSDLVARLERVEAELALQRLAHNYCVAADGRDLPLWRSVWASEAVWETSADPDYIFTGIDAICVAVQRQWETFPVMQHGTVNQVLDIGSGSATGRCDVIIHVQLPDGGWITGGGTYEDRYERSDSGWRIGRRRVTAAFDLGPLSEVRP
ncbi:nuclear transport factor 2 family protein [Kutzneria sp. 744]|uniref:nuclear transport factor 2 family protein n=1 Tax=Kutzneria sp. (strain 744) TaxID=345341 RepID=UPI0005BBEA3B|nr:nuclear transport factor 2 family protein [Kutzneria sp. 744]